MKEIKMNYQGRILTFQVGAVGDVYIFCECKQEPAARGFFTNKYVQENTIRG